VGFSPDGKQVVTTSGDKTTKLWDVATGRETLTLPGGYRGIAWSPDGTRLVGASRTGTGTAVGTNRLIVVDLTGKELFGLQGQSSRVARVPSVVFSPDGKLLVQTGGDGWVTLWNPLTGKKVREWQLPGEVSSAIFSPDGRHVITGNGNGTIYVLRLPPDVRGEPIPQ
jgi:WD40 repeat protein